MSGMEGLSIVANVIAVVDLSLKVISWCSKYAQDVKDSSDGRARLLQAAITLHYESGKAHDLLSSKRGNKLKASQKLAQAMGSSEVQLRELETLLSDKASCSSLRWPLRKEKVESAIRNIENAIRTLLEVLQIDTT
uniref:NACHT-NTPase and P-loop NTPases N-terminal domain-containing protein n=3 Tax=Fusarium oxysporum TaxID=5507 RepID=A0A0D2XLW0_FUSOF